MTEFTSGVTGAKELKANLKATDDNLSGGMMLEGMHQATLLVDRDAKLNAPVDTGRLRASITPEVTSPFGGGIQGVVGSNVLYASFQELGTRPHWPPLAALTVWAQRHGTTAFVVARGIAMKGNKAVHYLQNAFDTNKERIQQLIGRVVDAVVNKYG